MQLTSVSRAENRPETGTARRPVESCPVQIPGQLPFSPPLAAAAPTPRAEESPWPFSHATQYVPGEQGQVQPVLKVPFHASETTLGGVPQSFQDASGGTHHALISPDRTQLRVLKSSGELDFCFKSPNYVQQVEYQAQTDTYYVRSNETIHALSGKDGSEIATISPEKANCLGKMTLLENGDLALVQPLDTFWNGSVVVLKPDLTPRWNRDIDIATNGLLDVGRGHMAVFKDGDDLAVLDDKGQEVLRSKDPSLYSPIVHEGRLMFLEAHPSKYDRKYKQVVRYDSATGKVTRVKVSAEADRIIPLPRGGFLLEDGEAGHPHLSVYNGEGERVKQFKFPPDRYARQLHLSDDGKTALVVLGDGEASLYRLDLEPHPSAWNLVGLQGAEKPEPIYQRPGGFTPALLSNGQVAIFHGGGIDLDGRRLDSTQELLQAVGPEVRLASSTHPMSSISVNEKSRGSGSLDKLLCDVQQQYKLPDVRVSSPDRQPYLTPDDCMNFPLPCLGAMPAAQKLTLVDTERVLRSLLREEPTTMQAFGDWKLELGQDALRLTDAEGQQRYRGGAFSAALPVQLGPEKFVAAVGNGDLVWLKPLKHDFASETYSLGEPIRGLELSPDGRSVLATTGSGARLEFSPPELGGGLKDATAPPPPPEGKAGVHETGTTVQVGGVIIRKKRA